MVDWVEDVFQRCAVIRLLCQRVLRGSDLSRIRLLELQSACCLSTGHSKKVLGHRWCSKGIKAEKDSSGEQGVTGDHKTHPGEKVTTKGVVLSWSFVFSGVFIKKDVSVRRYGKL